MVQRSDGDALSTRSFDTALDALDDVSRRRLLVGLVDHAPQNAAAAGLAWPETDSEDALQSMVHVNLPKLERDSYVDWDRHTNDVVKGPNFDDSRPLLGLLAEHEDELPAGWL